MFIYFSTYIKSPRYFRSFFTLGGRISLIRPQVPSTVPHSLHFPDGNFFFLSHNLYFFSLKFFPSVFLHWVYFKLTLHVHDYINTHYYVHCESWGGCLHEQDIFVQALPSLLAESSKADDLPQTWTRPKPQNNLLPLT